MEKAVEKKVFVRSRSSLLYVSLTSIALSVFLTVKLPIFIFMWLLLFFVFPLIFAIGRLVSRVEIANGNLIRKGILFGQEFDIAELEVVILEQKIRRLITREAKPKRIDLQGLIHIGPHDLIGIMYSYPLIQRKDQERFKQEIHALNPNVEFISEKVHFRDIFRVFW